MTSAPANLLAARRLLLAHLGPDVKPPAGVTILDPLGDPVWEIGIVGDADHRGGYHCGSDRLDPSRDYSVVESSRDRAGLSLYAAGFDVGKFRVRTPKGTFDLPHYSRWLVAQCAAGTADTRHIREVIYSPDGRTVRRWDRLGRRTTGDNSHLGHTHESYFRDAIKAGADLTAVKRRYLTTIGLIQAPSTVEADVTPEEHEWLKTIHRNQTVLDGRNPTGQIYTRMAMGEDHTGAEMPAHPSLKSLGSQLTTLQTAVLGAVQGLDAKAIIARINEIAAAETERDAQAAKERAEILDLLRRWQSGELDATEVLRRMGEVLTAGTTPQQS